MRVLVVEDEVRLARGLRQALEREGHAVDVASDGPDALWYAGENAYDVITLDLMLPGMNGYDVCRRLREGDDWTPVLMLTARESSADAVAGLDSGADDYVTKPFCFDVLLARLRSLARRNVVERPATIEVDGLVLDPASRKVHRDGEPIPLTAREFAVLEHLLRNRGSVVTRSQLLGAVWGFHFEGDPNIIEVFIGRIRQKVDRPFGADTIETVRGSGYRVRGDDE